jgi:peptide chain release factor 2
VTLFRISLSASMRWGGTFDVDALRHSLDQLNDLTTRPGFWDDAEKAQKTVRERAAVEETLNKLLKLSGDVKSLGELLELAAAENDQAIIDDVGAQVPGLQKGVREMEIQVGCDRDHPSGHRRRRCAGLGGDAAADVPALVRAQGVQGRDDRSAAR